LFGFAKQLRLNQAADFRRLFRAGKKLNTQYFAIYSCPNQLSNPRLGLVIAKKTVRSAVKRNQFKRISRESFRLRQAGFAGLDIMIVTYKGIDELDKTQLRLQLERGWSRLIDWYKKA